MIFAYAVAVLFFDVYDMAIDTIFLCFCEYTVNSGIAVIKILTENVLRFQSFGDDS